MIKLTSTTQKAVASLVVLTALFASLSVIARILSDDFTILQQVYLRILVALVISVIVFRRYINWNKILHLPRREWAILGFRGFISYGVAVPFISLAATTTLIGNVAFIAALPFVPLLGFLFLSEKVTWWKAAFIFSSLFGVSLLAIHDLSAPWQWGIGDIFALIANFAFALGYISRKWHGKSLNNQEITTLTFLLGTGFGVAISLLLGEGIPKLDSSWVIWLAVLFGGIFNVINLFLLNYSFEHLDAVRAGNLLNLEVAWGLIFGLIFYNEWLSWQGFVGGLIIIASVIGMNIYSRRHEAKIAAVQEESAT